MQPTCGSGDGALRRRREDGRCSSGCLRGSRAATPPAVGEVALDAVGAFSPPGRPRRRRAPDEVGTCWRPAPASNAEVPFGAIDPDRTEVKGTISATSSRTRQKRPTSRRLSEHQAEVDDHRGTGLDGGELAGGGAVDHRLRLGLDETGIELLHLVTGQRAELDFGVRRRRRAGRGRGRRCGRGERRAESQGEPKVDTKGESGGPPAEHAGSVLHAHGRAWRPRRRAAPL